LGTGALITHTYRGAPAIAGQPPPAPYPTLPRRQPPGTDPEPLAELVREPGLGGQTNLQ